MFELAETERDAANYMDVLVVNPGEDSFSVFLNQRRPLSQARVVDCYVFYNQSFWDENDAEANANDDNAKATDKAALLPDQTARRVRKMCNRMSPSISQ